jgi:uncharacterized membrane protein
MTTALPLSTLLICYGFTVLAFFVIDIVWLAGPAKSFYASQLGDMLRESPRWGVAILFYLLYIVGIVFFASRFGLSSPEGGADSIKTAALYGAAFGFFCYATYDLTNLATLKGWPPKMVVVDIIWGTVLTGSCAAVGVWLTQLVTR